MPRSLKKGPFVDDHLAKKVAAQSRDPYAAEHLRAFVERWAASAQGIQQEGLTP